jgi:hypothetical protein
LYFRYLDEKKWQVVKEDVLPGTKWPVDKLHAGVYKLEVVATAPRYTNSDTAVIEHIVKPTEAELTAAIQ